MQNNISLIQGITTYSVLREGKFCHQHFFLDNLLKFLYSNTQFCAPLGYLGLPAPRLTPLLIKLPCLHYPEYAVYASILCPRVSALQVLESTLPQDSIHKLQGHQEHRM